MCLDLEDCNEVFCALFTLMFKIVNDEHSGKVIFLTTNFTLAVPAVNFVPFTNKIFQNRPEYLQSEYKRAYVQKLDIEKNPQFLGDFHQT